MELDADVGSPMGRGDGCANSQAISMRDGGHSRLAPAAACTKACFWSDLAPAAACTKACFLVRPWGAPRKRPGGVASTSVAYNHGNLSANQISGHCRQSIVLTVSPTIFDRHIAAVVIAGFAQALAERTSRAETLVPLTNPITGMTGCCARAASGQAAAPPSSVINSRRLIHPPAINQATIG
jgi:hypothetical protein